MAPWHLVLNDDCCLKLFELCDGKSLAHIARTDKRLHARVSDRNSTAASPGAQVWRQLCASHNLRQPGTRTRGQLPWSKVYALSICIECSEFGEVVINDPPNVLGFERGRFALCRRCMRSDTLWRVMNRPEIRGDGQKLAHLLFRIETVRRELGLKPRYKRAVAASSSRRRRRRRDAVTARLYRGFSPSSRRTVSMRKSRCASFWPSPLISGRFITRQSVSDRMQRRHSAKRPRSKPKTFGGSLMTTSPNSEHSMQMLSA